MQQDKSNNGKRERMSMCTSVYVFLNNTKQMFAPLYILRSSDKMHPLQYAWDWINSLLNEFHCWAEHKMLIIHSRCLLRFCGHHSHHLSYFLNGSLCISQAISSRHDFLWGSHFLTWILSMWPACPVHTDTPVQPVWQPVYCWFYGMAKVQYLKPDSVV